MKGAVKCSCCGSRAIYVEWKVTPTCIWWAVECEMLCFITDFFSTKRRAIKQWNDEDIQKSLAILGKWERRFR
jgi:hypothetical protein